MKRFLAGLLLVGLAAAVAAAPAWGQDKKVEFVLSVHAMTGWTEDAFGGLGLGAGAQVDIRVTKGFMISPEFLFVTNAMLSAVVGLPAVTFNYLGRGFFIGAGVTLPMSVFGGGDTGKLLPKIQVGYRGQKISLSVYVVSAFRRIDSYGMAGAGIGYRF